MRLKISFSATLKPMAGRCSTANHTARPVFPEHERTMMIVTAVREHARNEAMLTETRIFVGCAHCGKRLVEFEPLRVVAGSVLILQVDEEPMPYCEECVNVLFPEAI